jgi:hypothetical protein
MAGWARAAGFSIEGQKTFPNTGDREGLTVCLWRLKADAEPQRSVA